MWFISEHKKTYQLLNYKGRSKINFYYDAGPCSWRLLLQKAYVSGDDRSYLFKFYFLENKNKVLISIQYFNRKHTFHLLVVSSRYR